MICKPFWCRKRKEQMTEPCSDCADCLGDRKALTIEDVFEVIGTLAGGE